MEQLGEITVEGAAPAAAPAAPAPAPQPIRPTPGEVAITRPDGRVQTVAESDLPDALAQGDKIATSAEYTNAKMGQFGPAASAVAETARTATFGLSDVGLVEGDRLIEGNAEAERTRQALREMREVNPTANLVGTLGGALLSPIPGGGGAAAEGTTLLARAGSRFAAAAPRAFGEGLGIGASQQLTEDYLGNHEMIAQKYLASALKGGLVAVVIGGGLHAGLGAAGDKLASLRGSANEAIEKAAAAEGGPYRALGTVGEAARGKPSLGRLSDFAEEQAAKSLMPSASLAGSELQKLGATAEEQMARTRRIGRTVLERGHITPTSSKAAMAASIGEDAQRVGEELGTIRKSFDRATVRPSIADALAQIEEKVVQPLEGRSFVDPERRAVDGVVRELVDKVGGKVEQVGVDEAGKPQFSIKLKNELFDSFETLHKLRRDLDATLKWDRGIPPPTPALKEMRAIRGILEDVYEEAADRAAAELGNNTAAEYATKKAVYADLKTAQKWATKGAARQAQNNAIGMNTMNLIGHAGQAALSGHPLALIAPIANHIRDRYGNQIAATLADRATRIEGIQRAAQAFDERLDAAVRSFFGHGKPPPALSSAERVSPETARALRDASRNPSQLTDRVASAVARTGLADVAPRTAQAMTSTLMRAGTWIGAKIPPEPPPRIQAFGPSKPRPLGPHAQRQVDNAFRALDADAFVDDLARGRVDRQGLEALKFINPDVYDDVVGRLRRYGMENRPDLTRQQSVALSIITGTPLTPLMKPETIRGFQRAYAQDQPPPHDPSAPGQTEKKQIGSGGPPPGRAQSTRAFQSGTDRMESSNGS